MGRLDRANVWHLTVAVAFLFLVGSSSQAEEAGSLIVTSQPTDLYRRSGAGDELRVVATLPGCSVLRSQGRPVTLKRNGDEYWAVSTSGPMPSEGYVLYNHAFNLTEMRRRVLGTKRFASYRRIPTNDRMPAIIRLADPAIASVWPDLQSEYQANRRLPEERQSPEPYFVMAHIWTAVGNNTDALSNYQIAAYLVRKQKKGNLVANAKYANVLGSAISRENDLPRAPYIAGAKTYWGVGMVKYRQGRLHEAVAEFTDAVRLNPLEPLYWYSRALTYKALGQNRLAERDARIGVAAERRIEDEKESNAEVVYDAGKPDQKLYAFQGPSRVWLQELRRGGAAAWRRN